VEPAHVEPVGDRPDLALVADSVLHRLRIVLPVIPLRHIFVERLDVSSVGELADAGYIEPLDKYVSQWGDWKDYPQAVKDGVSDQGKVWAMPYGSDMRWLYIDGKSDE